MFRNYLKIAWRNLLRNRWFSLINILGLSIGLGTCLIIIFFVNNELSYDRFNKKIDRIARVYFEGNIHGEKVKEAIVMAPLAEAVKNDYPEVEEAIRLRSYDGTPKLITNGKEFKYDALAYVDANFFHVFTLPFIKGDSKTALVEPNSVVLTKDVAQKYFGNSEAIGKTIRFKKENSTPLKITGIIENIPGNSHFQFGLLASMSGLEAAKEKDWIGADYFTYVLLKDKKDFEKLEVKLPGLVDRYVAPQMEEGTGQTIAEFRKSGNNLTFHLQRLSDIHLHSDFLYDLSIPGDIRIVYSFSAIALFMLLIACINFMNLSTAGASKRSKEIGVRKVLGSSKGEIVRQFLVESTLIAAIALVLSLILIKAALPFFNSLSGQQLALGFTEKLLLVPVLLGVVIFTGLLAGSYPAFYLSSFMPITMLRGKSNLLRGSVNVRSALVVFQFFISIVLIISTSIVYKQLAYIRNKTLGYNKDKVMVISNVGALGNKMDIFKKLLQNDPVVMDVSASRYLPGSSLSDIFYITTERHPEQMIKTLRYEVDEQYIPTLGIQLKEGRNFSKQYGTDSLAVIVNETAVKTMGLREDPLGQIITRTNSGKKELYHIIGVVNDFHFKSLHEHIAPLVMTLSSDPGNLIVKLNAANMQEFISKLKNRFVACGSEDPMDYTFLDERYNNAYKMEQKAGKVLGVFASLTIFIACMGLFGLVKFAAEQRTKEIGIRKILGASATQLSVLISKDFLRLILMACIAGFPVAWWIMHQWLQDYVYHTDISWWLFMIAGSIAALVALITVSFQSIKVSLANPVKALRTE
jgi:putative ABC transport system permease protein